MTNGENKFSGVEVSGDAIMPVIRGIAADALCKRFLSRHELETIKHGQFYPLPKYLALLREVETRMPSVLRECGLYISEEAILPPGLTTFEQFLMAVDQVYLMNHRGYAEGEIGHYAFQKKDGRDFYMKVTIPYPCVFDEGMFLGFAKKLGSRIAVEHVDSMCTSKGDPQCNYRLRCLDD